MTPPPPGRIALATPVFGATSETFITRHARGLGAVVITESPGPQTAAGIEVIDLAHAAADASAPLARLALLCRKGLQRIAGRDTHLLSSRLEAAYASALAEIRPSIVLAEYGNHALHLRRICRNKGVPLVAHFHGHDLSSLFRHPGYKRALARLAQEAAGFVVVNSIQLERLLALGCPREKIGLIPYGVPVDQFQPSGRTGQAECGFVAVGRMVAKKSPLDTIRAFARCRESTGTATLTMIGDGPLLEPARRLAGELRVTDSITFTGALSNSGVREHLERAQAFVQHSVTSPKGDEEGWPVAIAEAAACGLPVISTRHAGIPDQVIESKSGFLVDEHDWEAMGRAMTLLAGNPAQRMVMGMAARAHIEEVGDLGRQIARLREFLDLAAQGGHIQTAERPGS